MERQATKEAPTFHIGQDIDLTRLVVKLICGERQQIPYTEGMISHQYPTNCQFLGLN